MPVICMPGKGQYLFLANEKFFHCISTRGQNGCRPGKPRQPAGPCPCRYSAPFYTRSLSKRSDWRGGKQSKMGVLFFSSLFFSTSASRLLLVAVRRRTLHMRFLLASIAEHWHWHAVCLFVDSLHLPPPTTPHPPFLLASDGAFAFSQYTSSSPLIERGHDLSIS